MKHYLVSVLWAGLITGISIAGMFLEIGRVAPAGQIAALASSLAWPGFYVAALLGLRGGADGHPGLVEMWVLTFVFWWGLIALGRAGWRAMRQP